MCFGRVRDFEVIDKVALGVEFSWEKEGQPTTSVIFERNSPLPSVKLLTFYRCDNRPLEELVVKPQLLGAGSEHLRVYANQRCWDGCLYAKF